MAVEQRAQEMATTTPNSYNTQTCSTIEVHRQHNHTRSYGELATNGAQCGCDTESCDATLSESQPLLATKSTVSWSVVEQ